MSTTKSIQTKRKAARTFLSLFMSVLLAVSFVPVAPVAYAAEEDVAIEETVDSMAVVTDESESSAPTDIASVWSEDGLVIDEPGDYYLASDVETTGTLYINIPEGETATLDFQGHDVHVSGVVAAGIDASGSAGKVVLTDSVSSELDDEDATTQIEPDLSVDAVKATGAIAGVVFNPVSEIAQTGSLEIKNLAISANLNTLDSEIEQSGTHDAYGLYAGVADGSQVEGETPEANVSVESCAFQVTVAAVSLADDQEAALAAYGERVLSDAEVGIACGIMATASGVTLSGTLEGAYSSAAGSCDLYATVAKAYVLADAFSPESEVTLALSEGLGSAYVATYRGQSLSDDVKDCLASAREGQSVQIDDEGIALVAASSLEGSVRSSMNPVASDETAGVSVDSAEGTDAVSAVTDESNDANDSVGVAGTLVSRMLAYATSSLSTVVEEVASMSLDDASVAANDEEVISLTSENIENYKSVYGGIVLSKSAVYRLDTDINLANVLRVTASGITLDLNGHAFESSVQRPLQVSANDFTLTDSSEGHAGKLLAQASGSSSTDTSTSGSTATINGPCYGIYLDNGITGFSASDVTIEVKPTNSVRTYFAVYGIYGVKNNVSLRGVSIIASQDDMAVSSAYTESDETMRDVHGVWLVSGALTLEDSKVFVSAKASTAAYSHFAEGLALKGGTAILKNATVEAKAAVANAYAVKASEGASIIVSNPEFKTTAGSSSAAYGINLTSDSDKVTIDGTAAIDAQYGLGSIAEKQIILAKDFAVKDNPPVSVLLPQGNLNNKPGTVFAVYADGYTPTDDQLITLAKSFVSADEGSLISATSDGIGFVMNAEKVVASLYSDSNELVGSYTTVDGALEAAQSGQKIVLGEKFSGDDGLVLGSGNKDVSVRIDLNGHDVAYINDESASDIEIVDTTRDRFKITSYMTYSSTVYTSIMVNNEDAALSLANFELVSTCEGLTGQQNYYGSYIVKGKSLSVANSALSLSSSVVSVYGLYSSVAGASIDVKGSSISVSSTGAKKTSAGVRVNKGTMTVQDCKIESSCTGNYVYGLYSSATESLVVCDNVSINVTGTATSLGVYGLSVYAADLTDTSIAVEGGAPAAKSRAVRPPNTKISAVPLALNGTCSFNALLELKKGQITIGDTFALQEASSPVQVSSTIEAGGVFAVAAEGLNDISNAAALFENTNGSTTLFATTNGSDFSSLIWTADPVAKIGETEYMSLSSALAAAQDNDTITLLADVYSAAFEIDKPLTIDLAGKTLAVKAGEGKQVHPSSSLYAGIVYRGSGTLKICDSGDAAGSLSVDVGQISRETNRTYAGLAVAGATSDLVLDGATVEVNYVGGKPTGFSTVNVTLYGVVSYVGNATISNESTVTVNADSNTSATAALATQVASANALLTDVDALASSSDIWGARYAYGLYCEAMPSTTYVNGEKVDVDEAYAGRTGNVTVDSSSSVLVSSNVSGTTVGEYHNANTSVSGFDMSVRGLREISPDKDSALYQEILLKFRQVAKYDLDESSNYGVGMYYAAPLTLDDGTYVYAYSAKVDSGAVGTEEAITPAKMYVMSTYTVPAKAIGIGSSDDAAGQYTIQGTVSVESATAQTAAISANGTGAWGIDGATLSVTSGDDVVRQSVGELDLNEELDLGMGSSVFYPVNKHVNLIKDELVASYGIQADSDFGGALTLSGSLSVSVGGSNSSSYEDPSADIMAPAFTIGSGFSLADDSDNPLTVSAPGGNEKGAVFANAAEGVELGDAQREAFTDADGVLSPVLDGASLQWGEGYTVKFIADSQTLATFADLVQGDQVTLPAFESLAKETTDTTVYTFVGWSTNPNASSAEECDVLADAGALEVSKSATYYAIYIETPITTAWTVMGAYDDQGNKLSDVEFTSEFGQTLAEALKACGKELPAAADYTTESGDVYRFIGWRVEGYAGSTSKDKAMAYDPATVDTALVFDQYVVGDTITAYYVKVASGQKLATFKADSLLAAYAVDQGAVPAYDAALAAMGSVKPVSAPAKVDAVDGLMYAFAGWKSGYFSASDVTEGDELLTTLPAVQDEDVVYTAFYTHAKQSVSINIGALFYDSTTQKWATSQQVRTYAVEYGTNLNAAFKIDDQEIDLTKIVGSFVQDGKRYEFKGWSPRKTGDKFATWNAGELPLAEGSAAYYAVYEESEQQVAVTFKAKVRQDDGAYAYADFASATVAGASTLADAYNATNSTSQPEGIVSDEGEALSFVGWALSEDADSALSNLTTIEADENDAATYYAVYQKVEAAKFEVQFWDDDETTQLGKITVTDGSTVAASGEAPNNPQKNGSYFTGWAYKGVPFDLNADAVTSNISLDATYKALDSELADGAQADLSGAYVSTDGAERASAVTLSVEAVDAVDGNLSTKLKSSEVTLQAYKVSLGYTDGDTTTYVHDGFGTVSLTLPVDSQYSTRNVCVYWITADGSVKNTDAALPSGDTVTVSFDSYDLTSFGGNFAVVLKADDTLEFAISNYVSLLAEAFDQYRQGDYTASGWETMETLYNDGVEGIRAATSVEGAQSMYEASIKALSYVQKDTSAEVAAAKAEALEKLANAYAGYSKSNYTTQNWEALTKAYEAAKTNVNSSTTATRAANAASNGVDAMNAISAGGTGSSGTGLSSGSGTTSSGASSSGTTLSGSGTSLSGLSGASLDSAASSSSAESMLGADLSDVTADMVEDIGLGVSSGVYVDSLESDGPAYAAGIQTGDVITAVDGKEITSLSDLEDALSGKQAGDTVEVEVDRSGKRYTYTVTLGEDTSAAGLLGSSAGTLSSANSFTGSSDGSAATSDGGIFDWIKDHVVLFCLLLLLLILLIAALVWWLLRRRNNGYEEEDEEFADQDDGSSGATASQPAIQF